MQRLVHIEAANSPKGRPEDEILHLLEKESGESGGSVWTARFPVGTHFPRHGHTADMAGYVKSGCVIVEADDERVVMLPGDYFFCHHSLPHVDTVGRTEDAEVVIPKARSFANLSEPSPG